MPPVKSSYSRVPGSRSKSSTVSLTNPFGGLQIPHHPQRALPFELRVPVRLEGRLQAMGRIDCNYLAIGGHASVGIEIAERRSGHPVGLHLGLVVVLLGDVAVGNRSPGIVHLAADKHLVNVDRFRPWLFVLS